MLNRVAPGLAVFLALTVWSLSSTAALAAEERASPAGAASSEHGGTPTAHGQGENNLNPITWKTDTALWTGIVFLITLLVLWRFAWGPIASGLDKREGRIHDEIAAAERSHTEARQLLAEYERKLAASGDEVRQLIEAARRDAEQQGREIVEKARAAAGAEHQRALAEIDMATAGALKELADRSATLAVELAGKIIGSRLDQASHTNLIQRAVADFVASKPNGKGPGVG